MRDDLQPPDEDPAAGVRVFGRVRFHHDEPVLRQGRPFRVPTRGRNDPKPGLVSPIIQQTFRGKLSAVSKPTSYCSIHFETLFKIYHVQDLLALSSAPLQTFPSLIG